MSEHSLSVTLKAGTGYDSPWVVVYGDSPAEVEGKLSDIDGLLKAAVTAGATLRSLHTLESGGVPATPIAQEPAPQAAPAQQAGGWSNSPQQAAPAWSGANQGGALQAGSPHPEGLTCPSCGQGVVYKLAKGGSLKMWTCPSQRAKNDGHFHKWID